MRRAWVPELWRTGVVVEVPEPRTVVELGMCLC